jgi:ubiquinone biosynthesis protein
MLRRTRPYRAARVAVAALPVFLCYGRLLLARRIGRREPDPAAWTRAHARAARALHDVAVELGGLFVKAAQVAGARADFLPAPFVRELGRFHDRVPPRPFGELRRHVERELGRPLAQAFAHVDETPLAAASLAQVHRARMRDGREVVLKIQYPEARRIFPVDLASARWIAGAVAHMNRRVDPRSLVAELAHFIGLELDFAREAASMRRLRALLAGDASVRVPRAYAEVCTDRLLVMEHLEGIRITDVERLRAAGFDPRAVAERVAALFCTMIFEHGFFHGDPHPGNLLVLADGRIGLLDFGLAKELPPGFAAGVASMLVRGLAGDGAGALEAARDLGFEIREGDTAAFPRMIRAALGEYGEPGRSRELLEQTPIRSMPSHVALVLRTLVLLNGLSHVLVPGERVIALTIARSLAPYATAAVRAPEAAPPVLRAGA